MKFPVGTTIRHKVSVGGQDLKVTGGNVASATFKINHLEDWYISGSLAKIRSFSFLRRGDVLVHRTTKRDVFVVCLRGRGVLVVEVRTIDAPHHWEAIPDNGV